MFSTLMSDLAFLLLLPCIINHILTRVVFLVLDMEDLVEYAHNACR
jgi:hypothetical protein